MSRPFSSGKCDENAERNPQGIARDDSEQASQVEGLEIVMRTTGVKQGSPEETGEDNKQIDTAPSHAKGYSDASEELAKVSSF